MGTSKKTHKEKMQQGIKREYFRLKKKLPRQPRFEDFDEAGNYSYMQILKYCGGWKKLLRMLGEERERRPHEMTPRSELIAEFKRVMKKRGEQPTYEEFAAETKIPINQYKRTFGNWTKFLAAMGKEPYPAWNFYKLTEEELHADYDRIKRKLRRVPTSVEYTEMTEYSMSSLRNYFESYDEYLKTRGDYIAPIRPETTTTKQLIENYKRVKAKIGHAPTLDEIKEHSIYGNNEYYQRFKGYLNFMVKAGEKTPKQQAIDDIRRVSKKLGRTPTVVEYAEHGKFIPTTAYSKFGSWNNFLKAAKLPVNRVMRPRKK